MKPETSVLVLNWNGKEHLKECLDSLIKQSYKNFEIVFVDNGSVDESVSFVKKNYPNVKVIENKKNLGFAEGNNVGMRKARGKYIVIMNNDTRSDKNLLKNLVKAAKEEGKEVGIFASKMLFYDRPTVLNSAGLQLFVDGAAIDRGINEDPKQYNKREEVFGSCGGAVLFKKEMLEDIKLNGDYFDSDFFCYYEDLDLAFRARLRGWKAIYVPDAVIYHKFGATAKKVSNLGLYYGIKNKMFMIVKDYPTMLLLKNLHKILIRQLVSTLYYIIFFNIAAIKARIAMLLMLPKMIKKRGAIQKNKKVKSRDIEKLLVKKPFLESLFFKY